MFHPVSIEEAYRISNRVKGYCCKLLDEFMRSEHVCAECDIPESVYPNSFRVALYKAIKEKGMKDSVHVHSNKGKVYLIKPDKE